MTNDLVRLAEIEHALSTDYETYAHRGMALEHLALLKAQEPGYQAPAVTGLDDPGRWWLERFPHGKSLLSEWDREGAAVSNLDDVRQDARDIAAIDPEAIYEFDGLPESAQIAVMAEAAAGLIDYVPDAYPAVVDEFCKSDVGAELVRKWGRNAPARVAQIQARAKRLFASISGTDRDAFRFWFDGLPASVARHLCERFS